MTPSTTITKIEHIDIFVEHPPIKHSNKRYTVKRTIKSSFLESSYNVPNYVGDELVSTHGVYFNPANGEFRRSLALKFR